VPLANYRLMKAALASLREPEVTIRELPPEAFLGPWG
jgi:hypothetical protein